MRKLLTAALAALLILSLAACGAAPHVSSGSDSGQDTSGQDAPDLDGLFTELSSLCGEAAVDIEPATAAGLYGVEEGEIYACRAAGGVSADEVTLFRCADRPRAEEILSLAETRLADQAESYADYLPEEAEKLRNAVAVRSGDVVAVAVCADSGQAAELIRSYLG